VSPPAPLDSRRRAFAEALGRLVAEVVWRDVVGVDPQNVNKRGELAPKDDGARRLAELRREAME
jgi:hypothetical protein